jgi:hypothetical protein
MRFAALAASLVGSAVFAVLIPYNVVFIALFAGCAILSAIGIWDLLQSKHSVRRNYPILANIRFMLEKIRPEIRQYFLESETDGTPFNRSKRAIAYQRAKGALDKRPFGTQQDIYGNNFEWINHSIVPSPIEGHDFRITVGGADCRKPYALSLFNVSAMSFGALSANAIRALNRGAKLGNFAHDTGEGGISRYHREFGGDLIWEIGSGYFGCRNEDGSFCADRFAAQAQERQVKMVEIKLSQGAKPGHGGVLPGAKVTAEIANARGVPIGVDRDSSRLHRYRRVGGRHRRGTARIRRPRRHAAARRSGARPQLPRRSGTAAIHPPGRERAGGDRFRYRALAGARGRLVQCSPRLHVRVGLHPGAILSYRPVPDRRLDAEPVAPTGPRGRRQGRSRAPIPSKHARRLGRTGGSRRIGSPEPSSTDAHSQTNVAERGEEFRGGLHVPAASRAALRRRSYPLFGTMGAG